MLSRCDSCAFESRFHFQGARPASNVMTNRAGKSIFPAGLDGLFSSNDIKSNVPLCPVPSQGEGGGSVDPLGSILPGQPLYESILAAGVLWRGGI
jgi:hypothetical protein